MLKRPAQTLRMRATIMPSCWHIAFQTASITSASPMTILATFEKQDCVALNRALLRCAFVFFIFSCKLLQCQVRQLLAAQSKCLLQHKLTQSVQGRFG